MEDDNVGDEVEEDPEISRPEMVIMFQSDVTMQLGEERPINLPLGTPIKMVKNKKKTWTDSMKVQMLKLYLSNCEDLTVRSTDPRGKGQYKKLWEPIWKSVEVEVNNTNKMLKDEVTLDFLAAIVGFSGLKACKGWANPGLLGLVDRVMEDKGMDEPTHQDIRDSYKEIIELAKNLCED